MQKKCHEHGNIFRDFPLNKTASDKKQNPNVDEEGLKKVKNKRKPGKKNPTISKPSNPTTNNSFEEIATQHEEQDFGDDEASPTRKRIH